MAVKKGIFCPFFARIGQNYQRQKTMRKGKFVGVEEEVLKKKL